MTRRQTTNYNWNKMLIASGLWIEVDVDITSQFAGSTLAQIINVDANCKEPYCSYIWQRSLQNFQKPTRQKQINYQSGIEIHICQ